MSELQYSIVDVDGDTGFTDKVLTVVTEGVVIIYGNGHDLGDFKQFAESLRNERLADYRAEDIIVKSIQNKNVFFDYLSTFNVFEISELHIFSHAAGGGLYLGYHSDESADSRNRAYSLPRVGNITYEEVIAAEIGAVFTDDYLTSKVRNLKSLCQAKFKRNAFIQLWGCNSGVAGWVYSDNPQQYYWRALNEKNMPKPSIAQATADFFQVETRGATSGSHIEFKIGNTWQVLQKQPRNHNGIRLHPDRGNYNVYMPG